MSKVSVRIESSRPIFIEADADSFGQVFAAMSDEEQVAVFRAMIEHMSRHPTQWDYIAIALEKDENRDVREGLASLLLSLSTAQKPIDSTSISAHLSKRVKQLALSSPKLKASPPLSLLITGGRNETV